VRRRWVAIARGDEPPDLVLSGGDVLSVFTGEVFRADVAIADGHIVGIGEYDGPERHDCSGMFVLPGFIDGHCHIESSKVNADEFARLVVPRGTTTAVVDPHELANVLGTRGVEFILSASKDLPLGVYVMMPSCVPASPFESPAEPLEACDFQELLTRQRVIGIAEMMNYPAAIAGKPDVLAKMATTGYRRVDGHAPSVSGRDLNAYIVSGPGSDHECTTLAEALEKRRLGMWIMIREASMIRNLVDLLPLIQEFGTENCLFVTDDREAGTLLEEGHINSMVRKAVANGLSAGDAVKLASLNVARCHQLVELGAVAPGYRADLQVVPDLVQFEPAAVFKSGRLVAAARKAIPFSSPPVPAYVRDTVHVRDVDETDFRLPSGGNARIRVIRLVRDQVVTIADLTSAPITNGLLVADPGRDLVKVAVVERHHATGRIGCGFVAGFGLRSGAFASTVAHDAHNLIVAGVNDSDMALCVRHLSDIGGGLVVADEGAILGDLPLEIAGLMSLRTGAEVAACLDRLEGVLRNLGVKVSTPFMYLGFLALSVIPELRLTDQGLVDVQKFEIVPLGAG
jgi:adenine deaminase